MRARALILAALLSATAHAQTADLILTSATIHIGSHHTAEAIAVANGKILAAGTNAEVLRFKGPPTQVRNLNIAIQIFPGLVEPHVNLVQAGLTQMNLTTQATINQRRRAIELAIAANLSHGITTVNDYGSPQDLLIYEQLQDEGKLNIRIIEHFTSQPSLEQLNQLRAPDIHDEMLQIASLGSSPRTAPPTLLPGHNADFILSSRGLPMPPSQIDLQDYVQETYVAGRQVFLAGVRVQ